MARIALWIGVAAVAIFSIVSGIIGVMQHG
jgi:hypothetical protein